MKKILLVGLLATIADAQAGLECRGFYVGADAGVAFTKTKLNNYLDTQPNVLDVAQPIITGGRLDGYKSVTAEAFNEKKLKTMPVFEINAGYDFSYNKLILGVELGLGTKFGKAKTTIQPVTISHTPYPDVQSENSYDSGMYGNFSLKTKCYGSLMLKAGYHLNPKWDIFLTGGIKLVGYKYNTELGTETATAAAGKIAIATRAQYSRMLSRSRAKRIPTLGIGAVYNINTNLYARISYNYNHRAKICNFAMPNNPGVDYLTIKNYSHDIKLGIGYRF